MKHPLYKGLSDFPHLSTYANIPDAPATVGLDIPVLGRFECIPILFERPVSLRLAAHSLIHHYLRCGNVLKAIHPLTLGI